MIYVVDLVIPQDGHGEILRYHIIDTLTNSCMSLNQRQLRMLISRCGMQIANAKLQHNSIELRDWVYSKATHNYRFSLLSKEGNTYRVTNHKGDIVALTFEEVKQLIELKEIANGSIIDNKGKMEIIGQDTYEITTSEKFKESVASKYEIFRAKASLIGCGDISFDYIVENEDVKLKKYTGSSKNILLPSFITSVMKDAFRDVNIRSLNLNEGLKSIGDRAFAPRRMSEELGRVEIPSTVEIVGYDAFANNRAMTDGTGMFDRNKLKLRNDTTVVID